MKKICVFFLSLIVFSSCSSDSEENSAPTTPSWSYPTNNLVCIDNTIKFEWTASTDADNNPISYTVEIATNNSFSQNLTTANTTALSKEFTLDKGKLYYWRVKTTDSENASSAYSGVNSFYTEAEVVINHLPFAPVLTSPSFNSVKAAGSISLNWTATDADATDVLKYDVYFGTTNPPTTKVATDISSKSYSVNAATGGDYYWKVVVKDNNGGITEGQVWNFKTK